MQKNSNPKVSVIIPLYNAEKYIEQCLQSLLKQTLDNVEVIVVDDCSTDNSAALAKNMIPQFEGDKSLLCLKTKRNTGWSSLPRNLGVERASGKYIAFMDNDDFMEDNALEIFYNVAEEFQADIVHAEKVILEDGEDSKISSIQTEFVTEPTLETFDIGERLDKFNRKQTHWWVWNKFYRRNFLRENKIKFPNMTTFEDFVYSLYCIAAAKNFVRIPDAVYHWRTRRESNSHKPLSGIDFLEHAADAVKQLDDFMRGEKFFIENQNYKYAVLDFFMQDRLKIFSKSVFVNLKASPGEIYDAFYKQFFKNKPQDNVALSTYLFVAANLFKLEKMNAESENI